MDFRVLALDAAPFEHLYGLTDATLAALGIKAYLADHSPGFPCRVSLADAAVGERLFLLNFEHLSGESPYRSRHAIFVRDGARRATPAVGELPGYLTRRLLSVRAFDAAQMMMDADVVAGDDLEATVVRMLAEPGTARLHVHTARQGCYLAAIERA